MRCSEESSYSNIILCHAEFALKLQSQLLQLLHWGLETELTQ